MWSKIAEEMTIPWRAAEAMHWQMGENEMARRAGVVPFALNSSTALLNPRPTHMRHGSGNPRLRRESAPRLGAAQLPSLAELTAGLPAFVHSHPSTPYTPEKSPPHMSHYHPPR